MAAKSGENKSCIYRFISSIEYRSRYTAGWYQTNFAEPSGVTSASTPDLFSFFSGSSGHYLLTSPVAIGCNYLYRLWPFQGPLLLDFYIHESIGLSRVVTYYEAGTHLKTHLRLRTKYHALSHTCMEYKALGDARKMKARCLKPHAMVFLKTFLIISTVTVPTHRTRTRRR